MLLRKYLVWFDSGNCQIMGPFERIYGLVATDNLIYEFIKGNLLLHTKLLLYTLSTPHIISPYRKTVLKITIEHSFGSSPLKGVL